MENINVFFDTNAYRCLSLNLTEQSIKQRFDEIKLAENTRNITPRLSVLTLMELLNHLYDKNDKSYYNCKIATIAALHHTIGDNYNYNIYPLPDLLIQSILFDKVAKDEQEKVKKLGELGVMIYKDSTDENISKLSEQICSDVCDVIKKAKSNFVNDIYIAAKQLDENIDKNWQIFPSDKAKRTTFLKSLKGDGFIYQVSQGLVCKALNEYGQHSYQDLDSQTELIANTFKAPLSLYKKIFERIAISGYNMENQKQKRWNTLWDIYLLFLVTDETIDGRNILFVTDEDLLHQVCTEIGMQDRIIKTTEYINKLNIKLH